jgi:hypothetical protein
MSQWEQWFRGFAKGWFAGVVKGLSKLEKSTRTRVLEKVSNMKLSSTQLSSFNKAWKDFRGESEVITQVNESLDAISELDEESKHFLNEWMAKLLESLKEIGGTVVADVLAFSGRMCAEAHAQKLFVELWKQHGELEPFVKALNERMGEGYDLFAVIDNKTIEATYPKCFCPLVNFGLIKVPTLCNCSSNWLKSNFEIVLGHEVVVSKKSTVLSGAEKCSFMIQI